jgi:FKBP-type peptidyl-prolyl cis-trans isomerase FkpA
MKFKIASVTIILATLLVACNDNRVYVSDTGLRYQIHKQDKDGRKPKIGDIMTFHLIARNSKDSIMRDTHKEGNPAIQLLQVPQFKGSFEEGFAMMAKGDSMTFLVNSDSLYSRMGQHAPPYIAKGSDIKLTITMLEVQNEQEFNKTREEKRNASIKKDEKVIADYAAKNKLTLQKTKAGVGFVVLKPGNGSKPAAGDIVSVNYVGRLTNGQEFDNSYTNPQAGGKPVEFPIGVGQVIPGWDEAVLNMDKGSKHLLVIPSALGYGDMAAPKIPANSVLVFEVELIDFKKQQQQPQMPQMPNR